MNSDDDLEMLAVNNRRLERENKALRLSLWDEYFKAAIGYCLKHGQETGTKFAASVADEMLKVREARHGQPEKSMKNEKATEVVAWAFGLDAAGLVNVEEGAA